MQVDGLGKLHEHVFLLLTTQLQEFAFMAPCCLLAGVIGLRSLLLDSATYCFASLRPGCPPRLWRHPLASGYPRVRICIAG